MGGLLPPSQLVSNKDIFIIEIKKNARISYSTRNLKIVENSLTFIKSATRNLPRPVVAFLKRDGFKLHELKLIHF